MKKRRTRTRHHWLSPAARRRTTALVLNAHEKARSDGLLDLTAPGDWRLLKRDGPARPVYWTAPRRVAPRRRGAGRPPARRGSRCARAGPDGDPDPSDESDPVLARPPCRACRRSRARAPPLIRRPTGSWIAPAAELVFIQRRPGGESRGARYYDECRTTLSKRASSEDQVVVRAATMVSRFEPLPGMGATSVAPDPDEIELTCREPGCRRQFLGRVGWKPICWECWNRLRNGDRPRRYRKTRVSEP